MPDYASRPETPGFRPGSGSLISIRNVGLKWKIEKQLFRKYSSFPSNPAAGELNLAR
jgi:hypothetical protein